jgi:multicomponent Na+:H+ antiporter subunit E
MDAMPIGRTRNALALFAVLMLFWIMLNGSLAGDVLIVGALASAAIALFYRDALSFLGEARYTPAALIAAIGYLLFFLKELVKSNLRLAAAVLSPSLPVRPGFVKVRTKLQSRMGRLLLANSITLTPGTLTVELEDEWLYVHWVMMETADMERATEEIVAGFERYLEVMYG